MIVVILYDQIELNNHNLKSLIINEIVLLFNNKKILNHRHYEKRKKQSILEELIHIVINIIRFTETTVQPVLQRRFTKFVSPRNKSSSKYANIWWCRIETHVSLPCEKKKKNVQSAIDDLRLFGKCFENSGCKWTSRFAVLSSYKSKWNKVLAYGIRRK